MPLRVSDKHREGVEAQTGQLLREGTHRPVDAPYMGDDGNGGLKWYYDIEPIKQGVENERG